MGVVKVGDGCGHVHASKGLQARVGCVLAHPSADEGVGRHVGVASKLWGRCGGAVEVNLNAEIGNCSADAVVGEKVDARWGH